MLPRIISCRAAPAARLAAASSLLAALITFPAVAGQATWETASPESQGMDAAALRRATEVLANRRTKNFLVLRNGKIVHEWYAPDSGARKPHYTASMAKALVGGMSLMLAAQDGRLRVDDPASQYIPVWKTDPQRSRITIRHLATHSSGIEDAEQDKIPHADLPGWKGAFWRREPDPFTIAIHQAPVVFEPGTRYAYSNPGMAALAYAVTASLKGATQTDLRTLLKERILDPLGVGENEWSIGYGRAYDVDGMKLYANWGGGGFSARAAASVGQLMLQQGRWKDRQLVDAASVRRGVEYAGTPKPDRRDDPAPASGLAWWTNYDGVWASVPRDAFAGAGAGHQALLVVPSLDLVIVRNGGVLHEPGEPGGFWTPIEKFVFNATIAAISSKPPESRAPYPPSPVIRNVTWAPATEIVRKAPGSDNWPMTWAADDNLYTAYGDGWGFDPRIEKKLSLGFARVGGGPMKFTAVNIRSTSGERVGDGAKGEKASGLLSVAGTLYMWLRNAGNARLAWSIDHAATWTSTDWTFDVSFGHPAFLNAGKEYAGARDEYVYVYSPDRDSAYEPADRLVLARVPKRRIRERDAYEFLEVIDGQGRPRWTSEIARRGGVFTHPGRAYRSQVSYHPGLKRYLLCQTHPETDGRFGGGFGVYDAPQPWGPWTTVYFTDKWDVGPGESCSFPTKWMDASGGYLVFSGDDSFAVRRAGFRSAAATAAELAGTKWR
jgi:CubicO group peptidase (beta-lactamase class C family)